MSYTCRHNQTSPSIAVYLNTEIPTLYLELGQDNCWPYNTFLTTNWAMHLNGVEIAASNAIVVSFAMYFVYLCVHSRLYYTA